MFYHVAKLQCTFYSISNVLTNEKVSSVIAVIYEVAESDKLAQLNAKGPLTLKEFTPLGLKIRVNKAFLLKTGNALSGEIYIRYKNTTPHSLMLV